MIESESTHNSYSTLTQTSQTSLNEKNSIFIQPKNYLGITGFNKIDEISTAIQTFYSIKKSRFDFFMMGFLFGYKELNNIEHNNPRYVNSNTLSNLLQFISSFQNQNDILMPTIHYNTKTTNFSNEVTSVIQKFDSIKGIQLNIIKPDKNEIKHIKREFPEIKIILQINKPMLEEITRINLYNNIIDYGLIDPSQGKGISIPAKTYTNFIEKIKQQKFKPTLGIAGGFSPWNIRNILSTIKERVSIDVESGIRDQFSNEIDMSFLRLFILNAATL